MVDTKKWTVTLTVKCVKQRSDLPRPVKDALNTLIKDIENHGPVRGNWSNYAFLGKNRHHCHLKKGRPTYVAVWEVQGKTARLVEITYAGTHEKAPC